MSYTKLSYDLKDKNYVVNYKLKILRYIYCWKIV